MPKPKPSTISRDPYAGDAYAFIGAPPVRKEEPKAAEPPPSPIQKPAAVKPVTEKITTPFPHPLIERARNAAYWERATLTGIIVQALADALDKMEQERGEAYQPRASELRGGRPIGTGKGRKASNT
jgi:hypothetical protein